jgi:hypothetical protein
MVRKGGSSPRGAGVCATGASAIVVADGSFVSGIVSTIDGCSGEGVRVAGAVGTGDPTIAEAAAFTLSEPSAEVSVVGIALGFVGGASASVEDEVLAAFSAAAVEFDPIFDEPTTGAALADGVTLAETLGVSGCAIVGLVGFGTAVGGGVAPSTFFADCSTFGETTLLASFFVTAIDCDAIDAASAIAETLRENASLA